MWLGYDSNFRTNPSEIPFNAPVEELTNVNIEYLSVPAASLQEKFGVLLASSDYPDMMVLPAVTMYPGGGDKAVADGVFLQLNDLVENYMPNYSALRNSNVDIARETISDDGIMFGIYSIACGNDGQPSIEPPWTGMAIRQDWLDDLGLPMPRTIAEWEETLTRFKDDKGADAPLMPGNTGIISFSGDSFLSAYGVKSTFYNDNGTVKYGPMQQGYYDYLVLMRDWYNKGLIDPNFMSNVVMVVPPADYVSNGRTGATINIWGLMRDNYYTTGQTTDEKFMLMPVQNPVLASGDTAQSRFEGYYSKYLTVITSSCEKPELAAQWLDFFYTIEGMEYINFGVEGDSYVRTDDEVLYDLSDRVKNVTDKTPTDEFMSCVLYDNFGLSSWERFKLIYDEEFLEAREVWEMDGVSLNMPPVTLTSDEGYEYNNIYADLSTFVQEMTVGYIMSTNDFTFDSFVQQIEDMNIQKCLEIQQAAMDRYYKR
jgi:putative aldouronate transport system substrate-binding protein